jgi:low temperature requirement protein LtrA
MQTGFKHLHILLPYLLLLLPLLAIVVSLVKEKNETVSGKPSKLVLFALIFTHIQLLVGLALLAMNFAAISGTGVNIMKDAAVRMKLVEHPIMMIVSVVLITMGYSKAKRATNGRERAKKIAIFYGLGLLVSVVAMSYMGYWSKLAFMH